MMKWNDEILSKMIDSSNEIMRFFHCIVSCYLERALFLIVEMPGSINKGAQIRYDASIKDCMLKVSFLFSTTTKLDEISNAFGCLKCQATSS